MVLQVQDKKLNLFLRILNILTYTHEKRGEGFKEKLILLITNIVTLV